MTQEHVMREIARCLHNSSIFITWGFTKVGGHNPCVCTVDGMWSFKMMNADCHLLMVFTCSVQILNFS